MGTSVPDLKRNLATALRRRPALIGPPAVAVHLADLGAWTDPQMLVLTRAVMTGASFLGWGNGPEGLATIEPLTLDGYILVDLPGRTDDDIAAAETRAAVILDEFALELRQHPDVGGALPTLDPTRRWQPPLFTQVTWTAGLAEQDKVSVARVICDWTLAWQAIN